MKLKTGILATALATGITFGGSAQAQEIICETKAICQKLSESIQAQTTKQAVI